MNQTLNFTKVKFKWDNKNKAFVAKGDFCISNIYDIEMNQIVNGHIVIQKGPNSDILKIYFETEVYEVYLFQYENGVMLSNSTLTNPTSFNGKINEIAVAKRSVGPKNGAGIYRYQTVNDELAEKMIRLIKKKY